MNNIQRSKIWVDVEKLPLQNDAIIWSFKGTCHHRNNKKYQIIADITFSLPAHLQHLLYPQNLSIFDQLKAGRK